MLGHGQTNKLSIFSSTMAEFRTNTRQTAAHRHDCDNILPCQNIFDNNFDVIFLYPSLCLIKKSMAYRSSVMQTAFIEPSVI